MKLTTPVLTLLCSGLMTIASAQTVRMQTNVPFQFHVGNKTLPAGDYRVEIDQRSHTLSIGNAADYVSMTLAAGSMFRDKSDAVHATLSFAVYETAHVLKGVWLSGELKGYMLPESKAERELARRNPAGPTLDRIAVALVSR
jgi:hypothetical protein